MSETGIGDPGRIVLVVGVDLSDVSEHLLANARDLVRSAGDAELHVVHVVRPETLSERLREPVYSAGSATRPPVESARWLLDGMCERIVRGSGVRWVVHTPVGEAADEIARIARDVGAGIVVLEAHDHASGRRVFHRSVVSRIARTAPCSVLTIRAPHVATQAPPR
jgi:nucleotide-binding universal stress UspA family protein